MSFQEKRTIVSLIGNLVIPISYFVYVYQRYNQAPVATTSSISFWASTFLVLIPVYIVFQVILHVVFSVLNTVVTKEQEPTVTDEFDKLIELKSTRNFYHVFMAGFVISIITQALDMPPAVMFIVLMGSVGIAGVISDISELYFYRNGV